MALLDISIGALIGHSRNLNITILVQGYKDETIKMINYKIHGVLTWFN